MPNRIQRQRTAGWRMPEGAVYVGRPTKWGNPFIGPGAVDAYRRWIETGWRTLIGVTGPDDLEVEHVKGWETLPRTELLKFIGDLRGKDLCCWCSLDKPCHADVLLELANAPPKYRSGNARNLAIVDRYRELTGVTAWTTDEVVEWAIPLGLMPVPKRRCSTAEALEWERKLESAKAVKHA
jgi:hypothetical protein